jgi:hypothetical protein
LAQRDAIGNPGEENRRLNSSQLAGSRIGDEKSFMES